MQAKLCIIVTAAGIGARFGSHLPKQYLKLRDKTVLEQTLSTLQDAFPGVTLLVTLHPEDQWFDLLDFPSDARILPVVGGRTRADSVWAGLNYLQNLDESPHWVMVHDAARPCVDRTDLYRLLEACYHKPPGGILALPCSDTLKQVTDDQIIRKTLKRETIWRALTPQMFEFQKLFRAYKRARKSKIELTDESSAMEFSGYKPLIVEGNPMNIKITYPQDMFLAEQYLRLMAHKEETCV